MEELVKQAKKGNELAFKQLIEKIQNDLYRVARTRLKNEEDIKDAIQNTMIITFKNIKRIRKIESFKSWVMRVLINECNKIYSVHKKSDEAFNRFSKKAYLYDQSIFKLQSKIDFGDLIDKLKYDEKIIITLYYNSQFSCKQIAKILKLNENTVKSKLNRSKAKLKMMYEEEMRHE